MFYTIKCTTLYNCLSIWFNIRVLYLCTNCLRFKSSAIKFYMQVVVFSGFRQKNKTKTIILSYGTITIISFSFFVCILFSFLTFSKYILCKKLLINCVPKKMYLNVKYQSSILAPPTLRAGVERLRSPLSVYYRPQAPRRLPNVYPF